MTALHFPRAASLAFVLAACGATTSPLRAQPAPATDVFLVSLSRNATGWSVGVPSNISRHAGYDNQPAFSADGRALFFTRIGADAQADIWRSDIASGRAEPVRSTRESEYSASLTRAGDALIVVRVEADSAQRLWRLPLDGGEPAVVVPDVKPVGYFTFPTDSTVAMFVLGSPATLQVATLGQPGTRTLASNIGRSLHTVPGTSHISYVQKGGDRWYIVRLDPQSGARDTLTATLPRREDYAWLDSTTIVMGDGSKLFTYTLGDEQWTLLGDFANAELGDISRLAVSPSRNARAPEWLAVTAVPSKSASP